MSNQSETFIPDREFGAMIWISIDSNVQKKKKEKKES
jgi:hypothetical protein